jgi:hypothetical protein
MDATAASPSFGGRDPASDDLTEHGCLVCGMLVVIESDPGAFTTPPILSVHEASSESLNSINSNPGHMVSLSYLVVLLLDDRSREQRALGRLRSHRPPRFLRITTVMTLQFPRLVLAGELTACPAVSLPPQISSAPQTLDGRCKRNV